MKNRINQTKNTLLDQKNRINRQLDTDTGILEIYKKILLLLFKNHNFKIMIFKSNYRNKKFQRNFC